MCSKPTSIDFDVQLLYGKRISLKSLEVYLITYICVQGRRNTKVPVKQLTSEERTQKHDEDLQKAAEQYQKAVKEVREQEADMDETKSTIDDHRKYIGEYLERCKELRVEMASKEHALQELAQEQNELLDKSDAEVSQEELSSEVLRLSKSGRQLSKEIDALQTDEQKYLGILVGNTLAMERSFNHMNGKVHKWIQSGQKAIRFMKIFTEKAGYIDQSQIDTYKREDTSVKIVKCVARKPDASKLLQTVRVDHPCNTGKCVTRKPEVPQLLPTVRVDHPSDAVAGVHQAQVAEQPTEETDGWGSDEEVVDDLLASYDVDREVREKEEIPEPTPVLLEDSDADNEDPIHNSPVAITNTTANGNNSDVDDAILDAE